MQVRIPTGRLGDFLTFINDKKIFLNSRVILAEDVTNSEKIATLETKKLQQTEQIIEKMKNNGEKVEKTASNLAQNNDQQIQNMKLADNLKYSTVDIYIKEPQIRVAEIAVINSKNIDNKYKFNFFYDLKNALVEGFYMIQKIIIGLVTIWPIVLIGGLIYYFFKKKKNIPETSQTRSYRITFTVFRFSIYLRFFSTSGIFRRLYFSVTLQGIFNVQHEIF